VIGRPGSWQPGMEPFFLEQLAVKAGFSWGAASSEEHDLGSVDLLLRAADQRL